MTGPRGPHQGTLVLSLFPGIGLLDMAFEEEGVRGRRLLQFKVEGRALFRPDPEASVLASEMGKGMPSGTRRRYSGHNGYFSRSWSELCELQGLPATFDLPAFKVAERCRAIGNGVPLPMGRAVARAVKRALGLEVPA